MIAVTVAGDDVAFATFDQDFRKYGDVCVELVRQSGLQFERTTLVQGVAD
jgi:hypothetical protein